MAIKQTGIRLEQELLDFADEYGKERDWSRNKAISNILKDKKKEVEKAKAEQSQV